MTRKLSRNPSYEIKNYSKGIFRKGDGHNFEYFYIKDKTPVSDSDLDRINKLRLPPAWTEVWISSDPKSAIQAIGTDSKERKQYRYHQTHIEKAEQQKFIRLYDFIKDIPKLEKQMKKGINLHPYQKDRVIVSMLTLVKELHMRVGKEVYAREHKSYGVSSLKKIHLTIDGNKLFFRFKGKSNKRLAYSIEDHELTKHLKLLMKLDGDKLFQYIDENDNIRRVTDTDLNQYIQQYMGPEYSAKDFRTYAANMYFVRALLSETNKRTPNNQKKIKKNILKALKSTAYYLRHTRAISKKSYVMNFAMNLYQSNPDWFLQRKDEDPDEVLLELLRTYRRNVLKI
jgi:DNA topoisomerase I